jgi:hypothetical protein
VRVEYFVRAPGARGFAELAIEFASRSLRSDVVGSLSYLAVIEKPAAVDELRQLVRRVCSEAGGDEKVCSLTEKAVAGWAESSDSERFSHGTYLTNQRAIIWVLRPAEALDFRDSYALFHELGYHMVFVRDAMEQVVTTLGEETRFFNVLDAVEEVASRPPRGWRREELVRELGSEAAVEKLWERERQAVAKFVENCWLAFVYCANQMAAMTIAVNYFMLLNTQPYTYPNRFALLPKPLSDATYNCSEIIYKLASGLRRLKTIEEILFLERAAGWFSSLDWEKETEPLPKFSQLMHSIFTSCVAVMPKEVYLSNPQRYGPLFAGLDWDWVREKEIPALDTKVPSKPRKKPSEISEEMIAALLAMRAAEEAAAEKWPPPPRERD